MSPTARKIKVLRAGRDFTRLDLAKAAGIGYGTICRLESDYSKHPRIATLAKIADVFGVKVSDLL